MIHRRIISSILQILVTWVWAHRKGWSSQSQTWSLWCFDRQSESWYPVISFWEQCHEIIAVKGYQSSLDFQVACLRTPNLGIDYHQKRQQYAFWSYRKYLMIKTLLHFEMFRSQTPTDKYTPISSLLLRVSCLIHYWLKMNQTVGHCKYWLHLCHWNPLSCRAVFSCLVSQWPIF